MGTLAFLLQILLLISGLFLMLIILLQRGRGGGLAGAFGGAGGQSAFGTKAGDVFTWITVVTAAIWVLLAGIGGCAMRKAATSFEATLPSQTQGAGMSTGDEEESTESSSASEETSPPANETVIPPANELESTTPEAEPAAEATPATPDASTTPATDDSSAKPETESSAEKKE